MLFGHADAWTAEIGRKFTRRKHHNALTGFSLTDIIRSRREGVE